MVTVCTCTSRTPLSLQVITPDLGPYLLKAAEAGDSAEVQRLIRDGVDVNSRTEVCALVHVAT